MLVRILISTFWVVYFANNIFGKSYFLLVPLIVLSVFSFVNNLRIKKDKNTFYLIIFLFLSLISLSNPVGIHLDEYGSLVQPLLNLSFFVILNYVTIRAFDLSSFLKHQVVVATIFFVILIFFTFDELFKYWWIRYTAGFKDPNGLTVPLLFIGVVSLLSLRQSFNFWYKCLSCFNLVFAIFIVLHTYSRSGALAVFVFFFSAFILSNIKIRYKFAMLATGLISVVAIYNLYQPEMAKILVERFVMKEVRDRVGADARINELKAGVNLVSSRPDVLFLGSGMGATGCQDWFREYYRGIFTRDSVTYRIHNTYFAILLENGFMGLIIFGFLIFSIVKRLKLSMENAFLVISLIVAFLFMANFVWYVYFLPFWLGIVTLPTLFVNEQALIHEKNQNIIFE